MEALIHVIETYGLWVVFISVLLDQGGLPTPSYAPMIVTAALATDAGQPLWPILLVGAVAAQMIGSQVCKPISAFNAPTMNSRMETVTP